jgi:hypothetical protein
VFPSHFHGDATIGGGKLERFLLNFFGGRQSPGYLNARPTKCLKSSVVQRKVISIPFHQAQWWKFFRANLTAFQTFRQFGDGPSILESKADASLTESYLVWIHRATLHSVRRAGLATRLTEKRYSLE